MQAYAAVRRSFDSATRQVSGLNGVRFWRAEKTTILLTPLVVVLGFLVLYPIGTLLVESFSAPAGDARSLSAWQRAFAEPGMSVAIFNTLKVVLAVQLLAFPFAIFLSWLLARTDIPGSRWLEVAFRTSFLLPSLGTTTGWLLMLDPTYGLLNRLLVDIGLFDTSPFNMYSFWGIVFAHLASYSISAQVMLLTPAFRNIDSSLEEASRSCGASRIGTLARILAPVLTPVLLVVFLMSLIRGLEAFEIELVLGTPIGFQVYSTKIYQLVRGSPPDYATATALAVSILAIMLPLIVLQRWVTTRRSYVTVTGQYRSSVTQLTRWRWPAFALVAAVVAFLTLAPLTFQLAASVMTVFGHFDLPQAWTLRHWQAALSDVTFTRGLRNTIVLGAATALFAVVVYAFVAYASVRMRHAWRGTLDILTWLPFAIPGVILGLGYLWMFLQVPVLRPLYGTVWVLILVSWLAAMTLGVQIFKSRILQLGADLEESARVVGGSWFRVFRDVIVRLSLPTMAVVATMVFAITVRQVSTVVLLTAGPSTPLSILQLEFLYGGELETAGVVGSVIVCLSLAATLLIAVLTTRYGTRL